MLSLLKTTLGLVVALFVCSQLAYSQQTETARTGPDAALREKAFSALESLADQLSSLQSPENRARIGANIAESLWRRDESRARALFQLVHEDIKLGLHTRPREAKSELTFEVFLKLRADTLRRIAKLDAELAVALFRDSAPVVKEAAALPRHAETVLEARERALELELSKALARQNPEAALSVARKSLARGFDDGLLPLLLNLSSKNKDEVRLLYREIVNKLNATDLKRNEQALGFSSALVRAFPPPLADDATFRNLLETLLTSALAAGCDNNDVYSRVCYWIGPVMPYMRQYFPTRAARLNRWVQEMHREDSPTANPEARYQLNELRETGTIEAMLALATKYPEMEGEILYQAMRRAESAGDVERAQKIADDYRGNPETHQRLQERASIYANRAARLDSDFARFQEQLAEQPVEMQIESLIYFANHNAPIAPEIALKLLAQAKPKVESMTPGPDQIGNQMLIAAVYCVAQSDQGFAIMETLLPKLNELISAATKLDRFETNYLRDGEWNMSANGEVGKLLTRLSNNADYFAWYDFERAMNLAAQFERTEIRMMAQLKLAQGVLAGRRKRLSRGPALN